MIKIVNEWFNLHSVRRKTIFITKLFAIAVIAVFALTLDLPHNKREWVFFGAIIMIVIVTDLIFKDMIAYPLESLNKTVKEMAECNLDRRCELSSQDEFGELGGNLNTLAANLQHALRQRKALSDTLSHEMKTPLGIIRAYAEGFIDETDTSKQQAYAKVVIEETDKMDRMIKDLLDLSALEAGAGRIESEYIDIVELTEICAGKFFVEAPRDKFSFSYELPDEAVYICGDLVRLEQVISNFMGNARKYVTPEGEIQLRLFREAENIIFELFNDYPDAGKIDYNLIWQAFYRDKGSGNQEGSGLGLAITAQILHMHNFTYSAYQHKGGIIFTFSAPCFVEIT